MPVNPGKCSRCNHPWSLHGNGTTPCKAVGCKGGEAGPCPEFQAEPEPAMK
jgi:hypothetical protein